MPILNKIRVLSDAIGDLITLRTELVAEAIRMGVTWQELAFIDKISAIKVYKAENNCSLTEAKEKVDQFIIL